MYDGNGRSSGRKGGQDKQREGEEEALWDISSGAS